MNEDAQLIYEMTKERMEKSIEHLDNELIRIRAGKANVHILDGIMVDYYGTPTPLNQVSNISTPDAKTIMIQPWEKTMIDPIEKALISCAPPQIMVSCKPCFIIKYPKPIECDPLAQAPLIVKFIPFNFKITERFIEIVEFIDWKIEPDPIRIVPRFSLMISADSITDVDELSLPYKIPTS